MRIVIADDSAQETQDTPVGPALDIERSTCP
jgi:hypothetical protein